MIKQSITYENFDGETVTEDHYFHLSKSELLDMELAEEGGMAVKLEAVGASGNGVLIMKTFKELISAAYGQRVDGSGSAFYKTPEISAAFMGSLAFDALLGRLMIENGFAVDFINGIMPKDLVATAEVRAALSAQGANPNQLKLPETSSEPFEDTFLRHPRDAHGQPLPWVFREPTSKEMQAMTHEQLLDVMHRKSLGWVPVSS